MNAVKSQSGPCCICGSTNYAISMGGPTICPKCDCGNFDAGTVLQQAKVIERLRAALEPFIIAANDAEGYPDNHPIGCDPCMALAGLTVGDLRRAREILPTPGRKKA